MNVQTSQDQPRTDPTTAGSFTTGLAAEAEGFDAVLIESDPEYFAMGQKRLDAMRARTPLLERLA